MDPHEEAFIRAFIDPPRRPRWLESLASPGRRPAFLDRLNHCRDLDERYIHPAPPASETASHLRSLGAPSTCRVISCTSSIDGSDLPLAEALDRAEQGGWGTILCCVPGRLAYYYDELGERRFILKRGRDAASS